MNGKIKFLCNGMAVLSLLPSPLVAKDSRLTRVPNPAIQWQQQSPLVLNSTPIRHSPILQRNAISALAQ